MKLKQLSLCPMQVFHLDCFRCGTCERKLLPGEQFGLSNGKIFCKLDFDALPQEALGSPTGWEAIIVGEGW